MRGKVLGALVLFAALAPFSAAKPADSKDAKTVLGDVAQALGAGNLKSVRYSGTGYMFFFGEGYKPTDPWPKFNIKTYTRTVDFANAAYEEKASWTQFDDEVGGEFLKLKGELAADNFVNGDTAWNIGGNGNPNPAPAAVEERQLHLVLTPYGFVQAAMKSDATATSKTIGGKKMTVISFMWKGKFKVNGYIDQQNQVEKVETWFTPDWDTLGDTLMEGDYSDYKDFSGVKFPMHIVEKEGPFPVLDLTVSDVQPNVTVNLDVPPAVKTATVAPLRVVSTPLQDGAWILRAGTQSVAVEFKDYIAIFDASQNAERARAVIDEAKKLAPNKPVAYLIHTHHHFDHAGDLRTFTAEGAKIILAADAKPYYEKVFKLPHTVKPDELSKNPKAPTFITVKDKYVLTDGNQTLEIYTVPGNTHAEDMLMGYLPKSKTLLVIDIFNPAPPPRPDAPLPTNVPSVGLKQNLQDNLKRLNLDVAQFVSVHSNGITAGGDLQKNIDVENDLVKKFEAAGK